MIPTRILNCAVIMRHAPVRTCREAAAARRIPLKSELKTLVLRSPIDVVAVHLRAIDRLTIRHLKRALCANDVRFLAEDELGRHGLERGTINPWNIPFCRRHYLSRSVLLEPFVATNNSRLDEGIVFSPTLLLHIDGLIVGRFASSDD